MTAQPRGSRHAGAARRRTGKAKLGIRLWWAGGSALAAVALAGAAWVALRPAPEAGAGPQALPGPLGGPTVSQDVNTLVGRPAAAFALSDSEGNSYAFSPGQGGPLALVFHMGIN